MRRILMAGCICLFVFSGQVWAEPMAKHLIDAEPGEALLFSAEEWFQAHPIEQGAMRAETVFKSPLGQVVFIRGNGTILGRHIHTHVDEIVYVYKGRGEIYTNGKWTPCKAGDFHACPRGVAHTARTGEDEEIWVICFFTEPLPKPAGDRVMIDD